MDKRNDFRKEHLRTLLYELKNASSTSEGRYFHTNTIENLITHFEEVKTENDKNWVYESLVEYFKKCSEFTPSIDRQTSKDLFYEHIDKITDYYHNNLGFTMLINRSVVYFIYCLIILLCYIFFNLYVVAVIVFLILIQITRTFKKFKEKQVYGLFW